MSRLLIIDRQTRDVGVEEVMEVLEYRSPKDSMLLAPKAGKWGDRVDEVGANLNNCVLKRDHF